MAFRNLNMRQTVDPLAGSVICGSCGQISGRKVWNSTNDKLRRIIWLCNGKFVENGKKGCQSRHIDDGVLYQAFVDVFNTLVENKDYFIDKWKELRESDNSLRRYKAKQFSNIVTEPGQMSKFDIDLYFALTEKVVVYGKGRMIVSLLDGTEIECLIE